MPYFGMDSTKDRISDIEVSEGHLYTMVLNQCLYSGPEKDIVARLKRNGDKLHISLRQFWFCLTGIKKSVFFGKYKKSPEEYAEVFDQYRLQVEKLMEEDGCQANVFMLMEGDVKQMAILFSLGPHPQCTPQKLAEEVSAIGQKIYEEEIFQGNPRYCNVTALSGELHGYTGIREGYLQARRLNDLGFFRMEPGVVTERWVQEHQNEADYREVIFQCRRLQQALDEGDAALCRKRLDTLLLKTVKGSFRWTLLRDALSYCKHMLELRCTARGLEGVDLERLCEPESYLRIEECAQALWPVLEGLCVLTGEQGSYSELILQAIYYIKLHYTRDLSRTDVAEYARVNQGYLSSTFQQEMGLSLREYITAQRMEAAKNLLAEGDLRVQDVAEGVGIHDLKYFSRLFKKTTGMTPGEYKLKMQGNG